MQRHYEEEEEEEEEIEEEIDIDSIDDEQTLIDLLDETEDFEERKRIRNRLLKVQYEIKAQREMDRQRRENDREMALRKKIKDADEKKKQTLAMYDQMSKTSSPGAKRLDSSGKPRDLVEEAIQDRLKAAGDRKKRILAAYDHAARTQTAGQPRIVEFDAFKSADVSKFEKTKPAGSCGFSMSGGIPQIEKVVARKPPTVDGSYLDHNERSIRERVREADERKRRTLAAYDTASKTGGGGPKVFIVEEFMNSDGIQNADPQLEKKKTVQPSCCFSMSNGIPRVDKGVKLVVPKTPPIEESQLDPMERFIRARKREADERKRQTMAAYDMAAKTGGGGPKVGVLDDFRNLKVSEPPKPRYDPCFQGFKV